MAVYESKGPMSVTGIDGNTYCSNGWDTNKINLLYSGSQPKGHLKITNNTTGATKSVTVSQLASGTEVWDAATDDPTYASGNSFSIEFSGKAEDLRILFVKFDGSGHGEAQDTVSDCAA